jgi:hypothetical protein
MPKKPPFKRWDLVEYIADELASEERIGSIGVVTAVRPSDQRLTVKWLFPTGYSDKRGEEAAWFFPQVWRRIGHIPKRHRE